MSYPIEVKLAAKTGYHTPAEARSYYGKYSREGITWHWWGDPAKNPDSAHDSIVNYILGKATRGTGSVNYVVSNAKITMLVAPENVAWASQSGNPTTISVELSPHLNEEGYKRAGWLGAELEKKFGTLKDYKHSDWYATACPGTIDIPRIRREINNSKGGSDVADEADVRAIYKYGPLGRDADAGGVKHYVGKKTDFIINDHANSTEGKNRAASIKTAFTNAAKVPSLEQTVKTLRDDLLDKNTKITNLNAVITTLNEGALDDEETIKIAEGKIQGLEAQLEVANKEAAAARKLIEGMESAPKQPLFDQPQTWAHFVKITNTFLKEKVKAWLGK